MGAHLFRAARRAVPIGLAASVALATPAFAAPAGINAADTAWMIVATALVLMMTIPGLALFYSGMVRKKNVLATMAQSRLLSLSSPFSGSPTATRWSLPVKVPGSARSAAPSSPA